REYLGLALQQADRVFQKRAEAELRQSADFRRELIKMGKSFLSEIPFSHARAELEWMEGVVDLVVVCASGELWIVDWKTDRRLLGENEEAFSARLRGAYEAQIRAYAEVLERGLSRAASRLVLFSTELGTPFTIELAR
ncbi:MAG: nuclease superfamily, partial [Chthoniobacter sp.]|nr:nuclease superfamily [Chthoniobacter sp.]